MTLQQLEYIIAVDRFRHFAKAAEHCRVTQPTLSAMIQKLEEELEVKIFDRNRQPIAPTPVGELVLQQARVTLTEAGRLKEFIAEEQHSMTGTFRLGILPTIAPYLLPRFFPQLMKQHPQLDIRVTEMKTADIKQALLTGDIDAGIIANLNEKDGFRKTILFYEQFHAYVSRESRLYGHSIIRTSDLADEQLWMLDEGHCFRDQLVRFCQMKTAQASQNIYRLGSMETFMRMVESGKGVTFIPQLAIEQLSENQRELVRPFAIPQPTRQIILTTCEHFVRHSMLNALTDAIRTSVPKQMLGLQATQQLI